MTISEFDTSAGWYVSSGSATISGVGTPKTSGTGALKVGYDITSSPGFVVRPSATPAELPGLPRRLSLDVNGDDSWNVLYFEVQDASGELLRYWVGNINFSGWQTMSLDLRSAAAVSGLNGNQDRVLDLPVGYCQIVLYRNPGATKVKSTIYFDKFEYQYEPVGATAGTPVFVPSTGGSSPVSVALAEQGNFSLQLVDEAGRTRTLSGQAGDGKVWSTTWNGRSDSSVVMTGSVHARLSVTRGPITATYQLPYFAGLPARAQGLDPALRGINSFISEINTIDRKKAEKQAQLMEAAYVGMAREEFEWKRVEPAENQFDWAKFDQTVEMERAHGIEVLGKLVYGVSWNTTAPAGTSASVVPFYPPSNLSKYATYVTAVVHRYKDRVHYWEVWNEENSSSFWKPGPNAAQYTQLLKTAYAAIKAEDPSATVVLGGLSTGPDSTFLQGIKNSGGWGSFDVLAIHTYVSGSPVGSAMERWIDQAKSTVASYGSKPIWITEFGWSTYSGSGTGYIGVTPSQQRAYLMEGFEIARQKGIQGASLFELVNHGTNPSASGQNYGLFATDLTAKSSYSGYQCEAKSIYLDAARDCGNGTFTGVTPTRILDTRYGIGLSGTFVSSKPRTFKVAGDLGGSLGTVVPADAIAVVGNVTVTGATAGGYVYLGPDQVASPGSSTINFPKGDNRANGVTVPLGSGSLSATYKAAGGAKVHLIFDVTGYYRPNTDGSYFVAVKPERLMDSRAGVGVVGRFDTGVPQTLQVRGRTDSEGRVVIPSDASAVTGNLTITQQSALGYAYIGSDTASPPKS